jgi:hypothetical protein
MNVHRIAEQEADLARLRTLSLDKRGELIALACQAATAVERGRMASGLGPSQPVPWPESTWMLLRKYAPDGQQRPADE